MATLAGMVSGDPGIVSVSDLRRMLDCPRRDLNRFAWAPTIRWPIFYTVWCRAWCRLRVPHAGGARRRSMPSGWMAQLCKGGARSQSGYAARVDVVPWRTHHPARAGAVAWVTLRLTQRDECGAGRGQLAHATVATTAAVARAQPERQPEVATFTPPVAVAAPYSSTAGQAMAARSR